MSLTRFDVEAAFRRLQSAGLPTPKAWGDANRLQVAAEWVEALGRNCTAPALDAMVTAYIRSAGEYWPTPGQLLKLHVATPEAHGPSWKEPDPRFWDWYALRPGPEGPIVRYLPRTEAARRGLAHADDATCQLDGCGCDAVAIRCHTATAFGAVFGRVLRDRPPVRWVWMHYAAGLPGAGYAVLPRP